MATPAPVFPGAVATDAQLKVANNLIQTTLAIAAGATDMLLWVASTAGFPNNCLVSVDNEIVAISGIQTSPAPGLIVATGGRGFDGTAAAAHSAGAKAQMFIDAWHHNSVAAEVKAIESALGANLANVPPYPYIASAPLNFAPVSPGGSLTGGAGNVVTLTPVPKGINGTDLNHYLYISGGTGAAEAVKITGGTAVSGASSGTIIFTPANSHSGAWTIQSATSGVQEAVVAAGAAGGVRLPAGTLTFYAQVYVAPTQNVSIRGAGISATSIAVVGLTTNAFLFDTASGAGLSVDLGDMYIYDSTSTFHTAGNMVEIRNRPYGSIDNLWIANAYNGLVLNSCSYLNAHSILSWATNYPVWILANASVALSTGTYSRMQMVSESNTGTSLRIDAPCAGLAFTGCMMADGTGNNATTSYGVVINGSVANTPFNEISFTNCIIDGHGTEVFIQGPNTGNYSYNNRILFTGCGLNCSQYGLEAINDVNGLRVVGCTINAITPGTAVAGVYLSAVQNSQFVGNVINCAGGGAGINLTGNITNVQIQGNIVGCDYAPQYGIGIDNTGTKSGVGVVGNQFFYTTGGATVTAASGYYFVQNKGIDDVAATTVDAAALPVPLASFFTLTGTGVAITSLTGIWPGREFSFIATNAAPPTFTAGGNIGNTFTPTQNKLTKGRVDSSGTCWFG